MATKCGHHFCSLCIRELISSSFDSGCPTCRVPVVESDLVKSRLLDDIAKHFVQARPALLLLAQNSTGEENPIRKRRCARKVLSASSSDLDINDNDSSTDEEFDSKSKKRSSARLRKLTSSTPQPDITPDMNNPTLTRAMVNCPICKLSFTQNTIEVHADACLQRSQSITRVSSSSSSFSSDISGQRHGSTSSYSESTSNASAGGTVPSRQPRRLYHSMKERQIKELLQKDDLSTLGSRDVMVKRHKQWTLLVNSNLDATQPLSIGALRKQLTQWEVGLIRDVSDRERARDSNRNYSRTLSSPSSLFITTGTTTSSKSWDDESNQRHRTAFDTDYQNLIRSARASLRSTKVNSVTDTNESTTTTTVDYSSRDNQANTKDFQDS